MKAACLTIPLLFLIAGPAGAKRPPKRPKQADITESCITVANIQSRNVMKGIKATLRSQCDKPARVILTLAYFDSEQVQFSSEVTTATVDAGANYNLSHQADIGYFNRMKIWFTKVIRVDVKLE